MSERTRAVSVSFILMAVLLAAPLAVAQTTNASIVGIVTDPSGGAVPGATITVTNIATKVSRSVTTNEVGAYTVAPLIPGRYEIKASSTGFRTRVQPEVVLETGAVVKVDFQLDIGAITESVEVTAVATLMQTQEASVAGVISTSQLERIPVNARNYTRLMILLPGTSENAVKTQIWLAVSVYVLVAIVRKRLGLEPSLYQILQVLSVTLFEKTPILRALEASDSESDLLDAGNQLILSDF